jgi:hypothetical protein
MISHGTPRRPPARGAGCKGGPHTLRPAPRAGREASRREEIITEFAPREGMGEAWTNSKSVPSGQPRCSPAHDQLGHVLTTISPGNHGQ